LRSHAIASYYEDKKCSGVGAKRKKKKERKKERKKAANESAATSEEDEGKSCNNDTSLTN
jgi:hypothetical protein